MVLISVVRILPVPIFVTILEEAEEEAGVVMASLDSGFCSMRRDSPRRCPCVRQQIIFSSCRYSRFALNPEMRCRS